jgi:hypothetical protein
LIRLELGAKSCNIPKRGFRKQKDKEEEDKERETKWSNRESEDRKTLNTNTKNCNHYIVLSIAQKPAYLERNQPLAKNTRQQEPNYTRTLSSFVARL